MFPCAEIRNMKSILPWHPAGCPVSKSGGGPMSKVPLVVVDVPLAALSSARPLGVGVEPDEVEDDEPPELVVVSATDVTLGPVENPPGPSLLQPSATAAASARRRMTRRA